MSSMQDQALISLIAVMVIGSIILIGSGISGLVVSESCCFGENCSSENLCGSAKTNMPNQEGISNLPTIYMGLITIIIAAILMIKLMNRTQ